MNNEKNIVVIFWFGSCYSYPRNKKRLNKLKINNSSKIYHIIEITEQIIPLTVGGRGKERGRLLTGSRNSWS